MIKGVSLPFFRLTAKTGCAQRHKGVRSANIEGVSRATALRNSLREHGYTMQGFGHERW
jgi:hypothetical protein